MSTEEHSRAAGHETTDVPVKPIAQFLLSLAVGLIVIGIGLVSLFGFLVHKQGAVPDPSAGPSELPPAPRLQVTPAADLHQLRERENNLLNDYGWVDRKEGMARIPIDRAMDIISQRGLPARKASPQGVPK
jgi:hypothetical protein